MITCEGSDRDVSRHYSRSGSTVSGPDWYDINVLLSGLSDRAGYRLRLEMQPITGKCGRWGFLVYVRVASSEALLGAAQFGPACAGGAKTMAGACYNAIWQATDQLEGDRCDGSCLGGA